MKKEKILKKEVAPKGLEYLDELKESYLEADKQNGHDRLTHSVLQDDGLMMVAELVGGHVVEDKIMEVLGSLQGKGKFSSYEVVVRAVPDPKDRKKLYKQMRKNSIKIEKANEKKEWNIDMVSGGAISRSVGIYEELDSVGVANLLLDENEKLHDVARKSTEGIAKFVLDVSIYHKSLEKLSTYGLNTARREIASDYREEREKYETSLERKHDELLGELVSLRERVDAVYNKEIGNIINDLGALPEADTIRNEEMQEKIQEWTDDLTQKGETLRQQRDAAFDEKAEDIYKQIEFVREKIMGLSVNNLRHRLAKKDEIWRTHDKEAKGAVLNPRVAA